jgi:hypothetical protein
MFPAFCMSVTSMSVSPATPSAGCSCRLVRLSRSRSSAPDLRPVELVDEYLAWLTDCERSPNTVEAYAFDLRAYWTFLAERGLSWERVGVMELGEFAAWARRPAENVVVLADEAARLSPRTVNRMLSGVVGFYEFQARRGSSLAWEPLWAKDIWRQSELPHGDLSSSYGGEVFIHFERLRQPWLKEAAKRWTRARVLATRRRKR